MTKRKTKKRIVIAGVYTVKGYDAFSHEGWESGMYSSLNLAKLKADEIAKGKQMTLAYVYDGDGKQVYQVGSFS